jgi:hypothetical protein
VWTRWIVVLDSTKRWGYVSGDPVAETNEPDQGSRVRSRERNGKEEDDDTQVMDEDWRGRAWKARGRRRLRVEG